MQTATMDPAPRSFDGDLIAAALALLLLAMTTTFHYEALRMLARTSKGHGVSRGWLVGFFTALVGVHLLEVGLYAATYAFSAKVLALGHLRGSTDRAALDYFYFAAETYSTLGYGDLVPSGALRLIASVQALNGLLLLSWSGAFLFGILSDRASRSHLH